MRKLLLVTYHFPPSAASGGFRMLGFARYLPRFGWQPIVVAPPRTPWEPVDPDLERQVPAGTPICHVPYPRTFVAKLLDRTVPYSAWLPHALAACFQTVRRYRPDAVLTSGPPHCVHMLGLALKRGYGLPWLADFRDPWIGQDATSPAGPTWPIFAACAERAVMKHADCVIANAPGACATIQTGYPRHRDKVVTITNGYDPESYVRLSTPRPSNGALSIVHAGELYFGRDPRPFLDAIRLARAEPSAAGPFRVSFLGRTGESVNLAHEIDQRGLGQVVTLEGQVPYRQTLLDLARADLLLLLDTPGRRIGVPAKLYEYLGAGRPVLALAEPDGDVAWVLRRGGMPYRIASILDRDGIRQALRELSAELRTNGHSSQTHRPLAAFTRERLTQQLARCLNGCIHGERVESRQQPGRRTP
jgi:glycosyltransferase involved in cell wall biosynthesis